MKIKKITKIKFLHYVVKTTRVDKTIVLILIILKNAILFIQITNKKTKRKIIEITINYLIQASCIQSILITKKSVI
jgi:hypothetical protein